MIAAEAQDVRADAGGNVAVRYRDPPTPGLPSTAQLLTEGGDGRIGAYGTGGSNIYGCGPFPDTGLLALGSSTASVISAKGFAMADGLRGRLQGASGLEPAAEIYAREIERVRGELLRLCGLEHLAGLETVIGASGTDLHLIAALLVSNAAPSPTRIIMVDAAETGSRVATALSGCHFSRRATLGTRVMEGRRLSPGRPIEIVNVAIRLEDGAPRPASHVDGEVEALVADAASRGWRSLVVLVDVSKTGMIAPSPACVVGLRHRFAGRVDVLVDACQFRIAPDTLRAYLAQAFMVAVTGSKFVTGPTFSGALFVPAPVARRFECHPLPAALGDYCARADWPRGWRGSESLNRAANFGLLLRWEAALAELRAFRSIPERAVAGFLGAFAGVVQRRLADDPVFEPLPVPALDRAPLWSASCWDRTQTIFPFVLHRPVRRGRPMPLTRDETLRVHGLLQRDLTGQRTGLPERAAALRCQLGQPVACGERRGVAVSALRVCASARLVVEAAGRPDTAAAELLGQVVACLDKAAGLVHSLG